MTIPIWPRCTARRGVISNSPGMGDVSRRAPADTETVGDTDCLIHGCHHGGCSRRTGRFEQGHRPFLSHNFRLCDRVYDPELDHFQIARDTQDPM